MSIINSALLKTQRAQQQAPKHTAEPPIETSPSKHNYRNWVILASLAILMASLLMTTHHRTQRHTMVHTTPLTLDGTLESGPIKVAYINNHAYHLGDTIQGETITQINADSIMLKKNKLSHRLTT